LHTVLICPKGVFQGAGVETVVLFFEKGLPTTNIWMYELIPGRSLGKRNPLNVKDLDDFISKQKLFTISDNSWLINVATLDQKTFTIDPKNPNREDDSIVPGPQIILEILNRLEQEREVLLKNLNKVIK
jgi:type I restriction enzyme M protein